MLATHRGSRRPVTLVIVFLTAAIALGFSLYTRHAWEDYYITFRASKNLVQGHGLVFTPGERVHSFTSPLGVLLPALTSALTGGQADEAALWLFRVMGAAALGGAAALLFSGMLRLGSPRPAAWLTAGFMALEAKALDFSTNGMETGFLLLFIAYAFWALTAATPRQWIHLGAAWAGIMWTRPDGFIYIGLLTAGFFLFNHFAAVRQDRREVVKLIVGAGLLCTLLYLPWFLWTWTYYGSPIPHTIIAKESMSPHKTLGGFLKTFALLPVNLWSGSTTVEGSLMPTYYPPAGWSPIFHYTARLLGLVAMLAWLCPWLKPPVRAASLAFHGAHAYLTYFPYYPFPWYFPATGLLGAIVWGGVLATVLASASPGTPAPGAARWWRRGVLLATAWVLLMEVGLTVASAVQMAAKQRLVYDGNLRRIGAWLATHAQPTDRVFMEPLGYIGYFSQLPTDDYPGLSSPRMVQARLTNTNWSSLLLELVPDWAVLRVSEAQLVERESPGLLATIYEPAQTFDVSAAVDAAKVPDRFMLKFDSNFTIYRRRAAPHTRNEILGVQHQFGTDTHVWLVDGRRMRMVHASGTMAVRVPANATHVELPYGFFPPAYQGDPVTDGAVYQLVWIDGARQQMLFTRSLDPVRQPGDRGIQIFSADLPVSTTGRARLLLHTATGPTATKDWTCWGECDFR